MKPRPKFNPLHDDYYAVTMKDGSWLEYASTDQFGELFDWAIEAEKEIKKLQDEVNYLNDWKAVEKAGLDNKLKKW